MGVPRLRISRCGWVPFFGSFKVLAYATKKIIQHVVLNAAVLMGVDDTELTIHLLKPFA